MDAKRNFKIFLVSEDGTEKNLWSRKASETAMRTKLKELILSQREKYEQNKERCKIRVYDENGFIIAEESFH